MMAGRIILACGLGMALLTCSVEAARTLTGCAALYGQCGGIGFGGATCCTTGSCQVQNPYYSQCVGGSSNPPPDAPASNPPPADDVIRRCGTSWGQADSTCGGQVCGPTINNWQCPSGQSCWSNVKSCSGGGPVASEPTPLPQPVPIPRDSGATYNGDLTWYGGAGKAGNCGSDFRYPGFSTIAMNKLQYADGAACGACVSACYTDKVGRHCFNAIVDNQCPECLFGSIDWGEPIPPNGGRWPVEWSYIPCPSAASRVTSQGSNPNYGKIQVAGVGRIMSMTCNNHPWPRSQDGWFVGSPMGGPLLTSGFTCTYQQSPEQGGRFVDVDVPGYLFNN